jgi:hypothetical protein
LRWILNTVKDIIPRMLIRVYSHVQVDKEDQMLEIYSRVILWADVIVIQPQYDGVVLVR